VPAAWSECMCKSTEQCVEVLLGWLLLGLVVVLLLSVWGLQDAAADQSWVHRSTSRTAVADAVPFSLDLMHLLTTGISHLKIVCVEQVSDGCTGTAPGHGTHPPQSRTQSQDHVYEETHWYLWSTTSCNKPLCRSCSKTSCPFHVIQVVGARKHVRILKLCAMIILYRKDRRTGALQKFASDRI
jgi:hypothetical protein